MLLSSVPSFNNYINPPPASQGPFDLPLARKKEI